jgi:hypothetical protein
VSSRRLLLIDDEDDVREVAQLSLELVGHWDVIPARIPVVLFTSKIFASDSERAGLEDIAVIGKPFDPMRLPAQVARALGWPL